MSLITSCILLYLSVESLLNFCRIISNDIGCLIFSWYSTFCKTQQNKIIILDIIKDSLMINNFFRSFHYLPANEFSHRQYCLLLNRLPVLLWTDYCLIFHYRVLSSNLTCYDLLYTLLRWVSALYRKLLVLCAVLCIGVCWQWISCNWQLKELIQKTCYFISATERYYTQPMHM